jgi:PPE-repeat protein
VDRCNVGVDGGRGRTFVTWLSAAAVQAEHTTSQAMAAAAAFEAAFMLTVPAPVIAANRLC